MTYAESNTLTTDPEFRGRIKIACLKFADYISNEPGTIPAHNIRNRWALECFRNPDIAASQIQPTVVMDGAVQSAGAAITDEALQSSVESVVNKLM